MGGHNQVGLLRDVQTLLQLVTTGLQCLGLFHEQVGSQHHAIADDVYLTALEDTGRNRTQHILLTFELQGVACIGTALKTSYHIILWGQHVNHLSFTFVAPLQTQQDVNFSLIHLSLFCF